MSQIDRKNYVLDRMHIFPAGQTAETILIEANYYHIFSVEIEDSTDLWKEAPGNRAYIEVEIGDGSRFRMVPGQRYNVDEAQINDRIILRRTENAPKDKALRVYFAYGWDRRPMSQKAPFEDHRALFDIAALSLSVGAEVAAALAPVIVPLQDAVAKLNMPVWTRVIPRIVNGAENVNDTEYNPVENGQCVQVALKDTGAIRRRVRLLINATTSFAGEGVYYVLRGGRNGQILRKIVFGREIQSPSSLTVASIDRDSRTGFVEIAGGDPLFLAAAAGSPKVSFIVEEEYRAESPKGYFQNTRELMPTLPPAPLPAPTPPPFDITPVLNSLTNLANKLDGLANKLDDLEDAVRDIPNTPGGSTPPDDTPGGDPFMCPLGQKPGFMYNGKEYIIDGNPGNEHSGEDTGTATANDETGDKINFDLTNPAFKPLSCFTPYYPTTSVMDPHQDYTPKPSDKSFAQANSSTSIATASAAGPVDPSTVYYTPGTGVTVSPANWPAGTVPGVKINGVEVSFMRRKDYDYGFGLSSFNNGPVSVSIRDFPGDLAFTLYLPLSELSYLLSGEIQVWGS